MNNDPPKETKTETEVEIEAGTEIVPLTAEDITLPEGFELDEPVRDKFLEVMNGEMTPKERSDALIGLYADQLKAASEAGSKAWDDQQTAWQEEVKTSEDIGGTKLQDTLTNVGKLLDQFGSDELRQVFDVTGAGNNVHVIRFLNSMASKLVEGGPVVGSPANAPGSVESRLFPSMKG